MRFIQNVLRSTLLHGNKTTKKWIQFLSKRQLPNEGTVKKGRTNQRYRQHWAQDTEQRKHNKDGVNKVLAKSRQLLFL